MQEATASQYLTHHLPLLIDNDERALTDVKNTVLEKLIDHGYSLDVGEWHYDALEYDELAGDAVRDWIESQIDENVSGGFIRLLLTELLDVGNAAWRDIGNHYRQDIDELLEYESE